MIRNETGMVIGAYSMSCTYSKCKCGKEIALKLRKHMGHLPMCGIYGILLMPIVVQLLWIVISCPS